MAMTTKTTMESQYIWLNSQLVLSSDAKASLLTHSLHYSGAVFEGEMAYNGKIFKLKEHTRRLLDSASILGIKVPYSFEQIIEAHESLLEANNISNAYVRPLIYHGAESLNIVNDNLSVNLLVASCPVLERNSSPIRLVQSKWTKPSVQSMPPQCKSSAHYAMMITSKKEALLRGYDDAILLDDRSYIAESTTSNIFFVRNAALVTPIADSFLNGITRQTIIELARQFDIEVTEERIRVDQLLEFEECFLTGTSIEVRGVKSIKTLEIEMIFTKNRVTEFLRNKYADLIRGR